MNAMLIKIQIHAPAGIRIRNLRVAYLAPKPTRLPGRRHIYVFF